MGLISSSPRVRGLWWPEISQERGRLSSALMMDAFLPAGLAAVLASSPVRRAPPRALLGWGTGGGRARLRPSPLPIGNTSLLPPPNPNTHTAPGPVFLLLKQPQGHTGPVRGGSRGLGGAAPTGMALWSSATLQAASASVPFCQSNGPAGSSGRRPPEALASRGRARSLGSALWVSSSRYQREEEGARLGKAADAWTTAFWTSARQL